MSIQSEIQRIESNITDTYLELEEQGADMPSVLNSDNLATAAATTKTVKYIEQSLTDTQKTQARSNINASGHFYGVCSTAADTAAKTVTVDNSFSLVEGVQVTVKFSNSNSIASPTLNVNKTGAKSIYRYGTTAASTGTTTTGWVAGAIQTFTYDGTGWIRDYWSNTTYSNVSLGQGYATCSTAAATKAKTASLSSYSLTTGGIVAVRFSYDVPAGATLNINSKGAKAIYYRNAAITDGVIKAGDIATFIYSTYYRLISIDRDNDTTYDVATASANGLMSAADKKKIDLLATVMDYGAKGDNSTDDTAAFQNALAANRVVYVPGGSYKLSGELVIRGNCQLELAQDAVLYFSQTSGNCITLEMSAWIKGNHATISVPYGFTGNVINIDTGTTTDLYNIEPFAHWDPVWKPSRYITDLNIIKPYSNGLCYSYDGTCSGTAIFINTDGNDLSTFLWGVELSGLRIAGAFSFGVYGEVSNISGDSGWNHDMRVDGFISGCEIGVKLVRVRKVYLSTMVQPQKSQTGVGYAKAGIYLDNSQYANLIHARVFDWNSNFTTWVEGGENQHLVMIGNCNGAILEDWFYYAMPNYDIRSLIYTDTPSNLETLTILQEPFTRWFKPVESVPYFNDGDFEEKLVLQQELDEIVDAVRTPDFTDKLSTAIDTDGSIFNGKGYIKSGKRVNVSDGSVIDSGFYGCTGFIPVTKGSVIYTKGLFLDVADATTGAVLYNSAFSKLSSSTGVQFATNVVSYYFHYEETDKGFKITVNAPTNAAYIRFSFKRTDVGTNPIVSVNNPIAYTTSGYLRDTIKVKSANVEGLSEILGSYIDDVDVLLGGG